jgi:FolB domain-containing protein
MEQLDWICIDDIETECLIGLFTEERTAPQTVFVNLRLGLSTQEAGRLEEFRDTVDYLSIAGQVRFLLAACQFTLIETAAEALAVYLLAPPALGERRAQICRVAVEIGKRRAMAAPTRAQLRIERKQGLNEVKVETKEFGTVDVLFETESAGIYRLNIAPSKEIPLHIHKKMREDELVLTAGLMAQGRAVAPGTAFHWPIGAPHCYSNRSRYYQTILCVDSPPFIAEDEIPVTGEPAQVEEEHLWAPRGPEGWAHATRTRGEAG